MTRDHSALRHRLAGLGVWSGELRSGDPAAIPAAAAELESLGYTALWVPDVGGPLFEDLDRLLDATSTITIATGVLNVWKHEPDDVLAWWRGLAEERRSRLLLGLGISHERLIGQQYGKPLATMTAYLDALEGGGLPLGQVCLAALGPRMLDLAATRTAGAHPYLVPPAHTTVARDAIGEGFLGVEQGVVMDPDAEQGRALAAGVLAGYGTLPNYTRNWERYGFTEKDVETRSDRLLDAMFAFGPEAARARVDEQVRAGADHVCIQVLVPRGGPLPLDAWRELAPAKG